MLRPLCIFLSSSRALYLNAPTTGTSSTLTPMLFQVPKTGVGLLGHRGGFCLRKSHASRLTQVVEVVRVGSEHLRHWHIGTAQCHKATGDGGSWIHMLVHGSSESGKHAAFRSRLLWNWGLSPRTRLSCTLHCGQNTPHTRSHCCYRNGDRGWSCSPHRQRKAGNIFIDVPPLRAADRALRE
ncbi:uncharacterized protein LOC112549668 isoform X2 [Alligator sinensis]|uniref:Uncharacterized protein LOC112549668 isoform X2 n=1 Tax=Alligator sinensis TaxID=38654 RepID=A0A3Q0GB18_ALLSI|nr:uncharacterized protein LOC112549668 isoform X2 [Alligator sinensis]